ncbi:hypothetical protein [Bosea sp. UC22_33]|uniref:hypothetical protein n=1 Tax=Bosea sp. UC22_33 TaxID=3350165 RepID=UPI0036717CDE
MIQLQHEHTREVVRDARGVTMGVIERQQFVGRLIARDARGIVVGVYDERSRTTRDAHGRIVGRTNLLPALLFQRR